MLLAGIGNILNDVLAARGLLLELRRYGMLGFALHKTGGDRLTRNDVDGELGGPDEGQSRPDDTRILVGNPYGPRNRLDDIERHYFSQTMGSFANRSFLELGVLMRVAANCSSFDHRFSAFSRPVSDKIC